MNKYLLSLLLIVGLHAQSTAAETRINTIVEGLDAPWAMTFLDNKDILVTERNGNIRVVRDGKLLETSVADTPEVYLAGQGGLLDIMLDAKFSENRKLYLSFAHGNRSRNAIRLVSAILEADDNGYHLNNVTTLFTAHPNKSTAHHYGGRIAQMDDGTLLMTVGDGYNYREQAQTLDNHFGKIIRIDRKGKVPSDNPFVNRKDALPEIWSYGHRNMQALLTSNGVVYENEHGPKGGDEVNIIRAGVNYGWPVATYGIDYNGARISPFTEYQGMQSPLINWTPSIAPSSMVMHQGDLYVTSLAEQSIRKITLDGDNLTDTGIVFPQLTERLRDIISGPDGMLYVLTDAGAIKQITNAR